MLRYPRLTAVVSGVLVGLVFFAVGRGSMQPVNIGLAALLGGVWGIGWHVGVSKAAVSPP